MRDKTAMTKNVRRFLSAARALSNRTIGVEGMAVLWGEPGEGKSSAVAFANIALDGIYLRATSCWTLTSMLRALMVEIGEDPASRRDPMIQAAAEHFSERQRPIFVDEADYMFNQVAMLDAMRDIYDITGAPVFLIGMEDFARKVQKRPKFARRITQWVEFCGIDIEDTHTVVNDMCEVCITEDLIEYVHRESRANIGRMLIAFSRIEQLAKLNHLESVDLETWGNRALFFDQPQFNKRGKR